jgi:anti-sigma regulatory factor (Ser/Thr protein kinase)
VTGVPDVSASLDREYDGEATTLRRARRDVLAWLSARGADEATKQRAALIVSELATNALQASPGRIYAVHVAPIDHQRVLISVRNHSSGGMPPDRAQWHVAHPSSLRGRGLSIVSALSDDVSVKNDRGEVVVTARMRCDLTLD